jgi:hypothetical protein
MKADLKIIRDNQVKGIHEDISKILANLSQPADWNTFFITQQSLHGKIAAEIEKKIFEKYKSYDLTEVSKVEEYIRSITQNKDHKHLFKILEKIHSNINSRYKRIEKINPKLKDQQGKIVEEVYKEYIRDGCREFDTKIYKLEFQECEKTAVNFDLRSYLSELKALADVPNEQFTHKKTKFMICQNLSSHYEFSIVDPKILEESHNKFSRPKQKIMSIHNIPNSSNPSTGAPAIDQQGCLSPTNSGGQRSNNTAPSFSFSNMGATSILGNSELPNFGMSPAQSMGQFVTPKAGGNPLNKGPMNISAATRGYNGNQKTQSTGQ